MRSRARNAQPSPAAISAGGNAFNGGISAATQPSASASESPMGATGFKPSSKAARASSSGVSEGGRRWVGIIRGSPRPTVRPTCSLDDNAGRGFCRATCGDCRPDVAGDVDVMPRMNAVGLGRDNGASVVGGFADRDIERYLAEKWNSAHFGLVPCATVAEYWRDLMAGRAAKARHVFDQSQQRHVYFLKHRDAPPRVDQGDVLRRRDNHRAGERRLLRHGELGIAGARRQIDDKNIELAPRHLAQHLRDRRNHHRSAPDHGEVFLDQKANRHHLDAKTLHRLQHARADQTRFAAQAEQFRLRGAIDVGVEDSGFQAVRGEAEREIARGGRLADASLAGANGDDVLDAGNAGRSRGRARLQVWTGGGHDVLLTIRADRPSSYRARANNPRWS